MATRSTRQVSLFKAPPELKDAADVPTPLMAQLDLDGTTPDTLKEVGSTPPEPKVGYKSIIDFGRAPPVEYPHTIGDYPSKIFPPTARGMIERFSEPGDTILDPFCGCGTFAVEAKRLGRNSINYDVNPVGLKLTQEKLNALGSLDRFSGPPVTHHEVNRGDARQLPLLDDSVDSVVTDIPYGSMIRYSDLPEDLSTVEDYETFLVEVEKAFKEIHRVLRPGKYCVVFVCDYRVGAARKILPIHSDVIQFMTRRLGFVLFDTYIWRYYRSGGFRPFGRRPFQAMNLHSYILVFSKPDGTEDLTRKNRDVRYRDRLVEKQRSVLKTIG